MSEEKQRLVVVTWSGLTKYAVCCLKEYIRQTTDRVVVISRRTRFPAEGLEASLGQPVIWVDDDDPRHLSDVVGSMPKVLVASGWDSACFLRWAKEVKAAGGRTIVTPDEAWMGWSVKELLRMIRWRVRFNRLYDKVFCCGAGGRRLFRFYGVSDDRIAEGAYAADPAVFYDGKPLPQREKKMIYVGQLNERKNVMRMVAAFKKVLESCPGWKLEIYGTGPLEGELKRSVVDAANISVRGYVQTDQLGDLYRNAQIFVLGSLQENWGVVVHEAALCGCLLLLSDRIGAAADFATERNSAVFHPCSVDDFARGMQKLMTLSDAQKLAGQKDSLARGCKFSPSYFAAQMMKSINELKKGV